MKHLYRNIFFLLLAIVIYSCGGASKDREKSMKDMSKSDSIAKNDEEYSDADNKALDTITKEGSAEDKSMSSSAAVENLKDTVHKFIRTADIKFRVRDVIQATYEIEDIVKRFDGFVTSTKLSNNTENKSTVVITTDSSLETTYYTLENSMVLRVPNTRLDTTLKSIAKLVDFLDYRNIKAEDVSLSILENRLKQKRISKYSTRVDAASQNKSKDATETVNTQDRLLAQEEAADNALISNLKILDQIKFSTVNLLIYQRQTIRHDVISNDKSINSYKPGLGKRLLESLKTGWNMITGFIVFIIKLWGVFVFIILAYIVYRWLSRKFWKKDRNKS